MIKKIFSIGMTILTVVLFTAAMTSVSAAESSLAQRIKSSLLADDNTDYRVADLVKAETTMMNVDYEPVVDIGKAYEAYDLVNLEPSSEHNDALLETIANFEKSPKMICDAEEIILEYENDDSVLNIILNAESEVEEEKEEVIAMWCYEGITYQLMAGISYFLRETGVIDKATFQKVFVDATEENNSEIKDYFSKGTLTSVKTNENRISFTLETEENEIIVVVDSNNTSYVDNLVPIASIHKDAASWNIFTDGASYFVRGIC